MKRFVVLDTPSVLGLRPTGVERLPEAMKAAGLLRKLGAEYAGVVTPPQYSSARDEKTLVLNAKAICEYSNQLAQAVTEILRRNKFPLVLGGDCSIVIGNTLALRKMGRFGLFFIDGHADFYQPEASPTGEASDMDLAIVSGRGPDLLTNVGGLKPLVRDEDIVLFGNRDAEQAKSYGSQDVAETRINVFDLERIRKAGIARAATQAVAKLSKGTGGFWIHLDVDVLNDNDMPAVDYRLSGGLGYEDLSQLLRILIASEKPVGMDVTIFNPKLDPDGSAAQRLASSLADGLKKDSSKKEWG